MPRPRDPPDVVVRVEGEARVAVGWGEELFRVCVFASFVGTSSRRSFGERAGFIRVG